MKFLKKIYKKYILKYFSYIPKRYRVVTSVFFVSGLFFLSTLFPREYFNLFLFVILLSTYLLVFFSILEGIEKIEWFTLFLVPVLTVFSLYIFYYFFPLRWLTRIPFLMIFVVSLYATILSSNVLNVGVEKALQLYRAGFSVNFFFHSVIIFLLSTVVYSMGRGFIFNGLAIFILSFILGYQFVWSIKLDLSLKRDDLKYAFFLALFPFEAAVIFSFVPINAVVFGILVSAIYYYCAGYIYLVLEKKLFPELLREFNFVFILAIVFLLLSMRYG